MKRSEFFGYAGILLLAAAGLVRSIFPDSGTVALGLLLLGLVLFLVYFFRAGGTVQAFLGRRSTREGGNVLGTAVFVIGISVLVNFLAATLNLRVDITKDRLFTLAPETAAALARAPRPPEVWVLYPKNDPRTEPLRQLMNAAKHAAPELEFHVIDPWQEPLKAAEFEIRDYATVVQVGDRFESFAGTSEESFLSALLLASREERARIGFVRGHGEMLYNDPGPRGLRQAALALDRRGLLPYSLDMLAGDPLADSADVVVFAGPQAPLSPDEQDSLTVYLETGGRLLVLLDPVSGESLASILGQAGLTFVPKFLADPDQRDPLVHLPRFTSHPVVRSLAEKRLQVVLAGVGEILSENNTRDRRSARLMMTGPRGGVAEDPSQEGRERNLAMASEWKTASGQVARMVVIGDKDFVNNLSYETLGNADLFLGAIRWLSEVEPDIDLRPQVRTNRPVVLSLQQGRALWVLYVCVLPLSVLGTGISVWWRRR